MKSKYGVVHGVARCLDCDWETESYKNAQAISAKHAKKYGHRVEGELGIYFVYDGRNSASSQESTGSEGPNSTPSTEEVKLE
uniref:Uncharacterized protein n=1 Tax=viral metagenome TaxID=1070528 RepID=A0A6M3MAN1_9ZZZZ